jgi:DNA-binding NtrC family response regulator
MGGKLLVVDDEEASCRALERIFAAEGFEVIAAHDGRAGIERVGADRPAAMILDLNMPRMSGLEVLEWLKDREDAPPVVVLTAANEVKTAVRATQLGAFDYLTKPFAPEEIVLSVRRALETQALKVEVADLRRELAGSGLAAQMGSSAEIRRVIEQVRTVAATDFTVLVLGETGTGKELVAQAIHKKSARRDRPFLALDCGAVPDTLLESELFGHEKGAFTGAERQREGRFRLAQGGTFFLDEVGNLSLGLQAKLLRVLESRQLHPVGAGKTVPLDVRFVAATNASLEQRVTAGAFRADLYFRLAQYTISLPPLRARPMDVPHLAQRFLEEVGVELRRPVQRIVPAAMELLARHHWPGNVRELRNLIRRAVLSTSDLVIGPETIRVLLGGGGDGHEWTPAGDATQVAPPAANPPAGSSLSLSLSLRQIADAAARAAEIRAIRDTLRATHGNKAQAARALRTDYKTLHVKMKQLGIQARDFES